MPLEGYTRPCPTDLGAWPRTAEMRWVTRGEDSLDQEKRVVVFLTSGHSDSNERKELINLCRIKFI